jgi:hypothetical protein
MVGIQRWQKGIWMERTKKRMGIGSRCYAAGLMPGPYMREKWENRKRKDRPARLLVIAKKKNPGYDAYSV